MKHKIEFYKDDKLHHSKDWDLGLDAAKQHASGMAKRKVVFSFSVAPPV